MYRPERVAIVAVGDVQLAGCAPPSQSSRPRPAAPPTAPAAGHRRAPLSPPRRPRAAGWARATRARGWTPPRSASPPGSCATPCGTGSPAPTWRPSTGGRTTGRRWRWWSPPRARLAAAAREAGHRVAAVREPPLGDQVRDAARHPPRHALLRPHPRAHGRRSRQFSDRGGDPDAAQRFYATWGRWTRRRCGGARRPVLSARRCGWRSTRRSSRRTADAARAARARPRPPARSARGPAPGGGAPGARHPGGRRRSCWSPPARPTRRRPRGNRLPGGARRHRPLRPLSTRSART